MPQELVGVSMPAETPQAYGSDSYTGMPVVQPQYDQMQGTMTGVPPLQDPSRLGFNLGGESEMDVNSAGVAANAEQTGQKSVFDHATIGGLSRIYDSGGVIDTYIPELVKALDRVGRILFLFYWKNDDFMERYGSEDMADMEDMIRNVFKQFGDLVLQLKEKAIGNDDEA